MKKLTYLLIIILGFSCENSNNKRVATFEANCKKLSLGMPIKEAIEIMQHDLNLKHETDSVSYGSNETIPKDFYILFSLDKEKKLVFLHFNKKTNRVTRIDKIDRDMIKR